MEELWQSALLKEMLAMVFKKKVAFIFLPIFPIYKMTIKIVLGSSHMLPVICAATFTAMLRAKTCQEKNIHAQSIFPG